MDTLNINELGNEIQAAIAQKPNKGPQTFWDFLASPEFYLSVIVFAVGIALWILISKAAKHYNKKLTEEYTDDYKGQNQKRTIAHIMTSVFKAIIIIGVIIAFLQVQGINVNSLIAGVSIITAIVGFALQDAIKDIICGMYILADHYFEVGEVINYKGEDGEVIKMTIRTTKIKSLINGNTITITNRSFNEAYKVSDWWDIDLGLSYDEDPRRIHRVLADTCHEIKEKIRGIVKCEYKGTNNFDASSIIYKIRCYSNPLIKYESRRAALMIIQDRLNREGIKIPYKHVNVIVDNNQNTDK